MAHLQDGAGIVADCDPADEQRECKNKAVGLARVGGPSLNLLLLNVWNCKLKLELSQCTDVLTCHLFIFMFLLM